MGDRPDPKRPPDPEPRLHRIRFAGLELSCVEWPGGDGPPILLLHGFLEHAWGWDRIARGLVPHHPVYALDFRGFGDSAWIPGGQYHFSDYVFDIATAVDYFRFDRFLLVGHSLGGGIGSVYAGSFPERVAKFVNIEGFGPPPSLLPQDTSRLALWVNELRQRAAQPTRLLRGVSEAARRLREANPRLPREMARHLAEHGTKDIPEGGRTWKFDPLHRTIPPEPFSLELAKEMWSRIECPTLLVHCAESEFALPEDGRLEAYRFSEKITVPGVGHMLHYENPDALVRLLLRFFGEG